MSNVITLTKILLKTNISFDQFRSARKSKREKKTPKILIVILFIYLAVVFMGLSIGATNYAYDLLKLVRQQSTVIFLGIFISSFVCFFFSLLTLPSVFFFSNDIENLLCLPFKPTEIVASKFIVSMFLEYLYEIFILAPMLVTYGIRDGAGIGYWLVAIIIFILTPALPLVYAYILNLVLMRYTSIFRKKDVFMLISQVSVIFIAVGTNIYMQRAMSSFDGEAFIELILNDSNGLMNIVKTIFPTINLVVSGITGNMFSLLLYLAVHIGVIVLILIGSQAFYFRVVMGIGETGSKREAVSTQEFNKYKNKGIVYSYFVKEMKILFRTPTFFTNCVLGVIIVPIVMCVSIFASGDLSPEYLREFVDLSSSDAKAMALPLIVAAIFFISGMNTVSVTSISREGQGFAFSKSIPVSYRDQVKAKLLSGVCISILGIIPILGVCIYLLSMPIDFFIVIAIITVEILLTINNIGMMIDIRNPKLAWTDEVQAVKQNMNSVLMMFSIMGIALVIGVGGSLFVKLDYLFMIVLFGISLTALMVGTYNLCMKYADTKMANIEV